jgi:hypothetical protein
MAHSRRVMVGSDRYLETFSLDRGTRSPLATEFRGNAFCTWNRDGSRIVYRRFNVPY